MAAPKKVPQSMREAPKSGVHPKSGGAKTQPPTKRAPTPKPYSKR